MRSTYALVISLALLVATPGIASADPYQRPAGNQKFIEQVIARALSQRGVPFKYGGGDSAGPTRGVVRTAPPLVVSPAVPGASAPLLAPAMPATPASPGLALVPTTTPGYVDPSANVVGFDASGLIVYSFAGVGVKLPRSSGEQYKVGRKITADQALPGDLLFYGPAGSQSVALFVGNGQMIEGTEPSVSLTQVRTNGMDPYLSRIIEWQ